MKISIQRSENGSVEAAITQGDSEAYLLRIRKGTTGWVHTWQGATTARSGEFKKPIWEYAAGSLRSKAAKWLKTSYQEETGTEPSNQWFKEEFWQPLLEAFTEWDEAEEFKDTAVSPAVQDLRTIIQRMVIETTMDDETDQPVNLYVQTNDKTATLTLNTSTVYSIKAVRTAFVKKKLRPPKALTEVKKAEFEEDVINWLYDAGRVEYKENPDTLEQAACDAIRHGLRYLEIVTSDSELTGQIDTAYYDGRDVWVPSAWVRDILEDEDLPSNPRLVKKWCIADGQLRRDHEYGYQSQVKGRGGAKGRYWRFKKEVFEGLLPDKKEVLLDDL